MRSEDVAAAVDRLEKAMGPSRVLDGLLAQMIGWQKRVESAIHPETKAKIEKVSWIPPGENTAGLLPFFTKDIQAAKDFAETICQGSIGGCSWDQTGRGRAKVDQGKYTEAASPALALCAAALLAHQSRSGI